MNILNKVKDKLALQLLRKLYGSRTDFSCNFYGVENTVKPEVVDSESIGIVFQGPIVNEAKLKEGLMHYRRLLPDSLIMLSTWEGLLLADFRDFLKDLRISYVESQPPVVGGIMNVNRQIISTERGILGLLEEAVPSLIVKARTDYFPWRPDKAIRQLRTFNHLIGGSDRIWGIDFNTRLDLPFSFSDFFQVGSPNLMKAYWRSDDLYPEDISVKKFFELTDNQRDVSSILLLQPAEIFLTRRYLERQGYVCDYASLKDYHDALANKFGILDSQYIELAFGKYSLAVPGYEQPRRRQKKFVKCQDWLAMISDRQ